jgi:polyisoprenoid-binding protein YceI
MKGGCLVAAGVIAWLLGAAAHVTAEELHVVSDSSQVEYHITHSLSDVTGTAGVASGTVEFDSATASIYAARIAVDLRALRTGIDMRDRHIHSSDYLDTARFPTAQFDFAVALPDSGDGALRARGTLALHGVEREVEVPLRLHAQAGGVRVRGTFTIALADHGIARPKMMMLAAGKTVDVRIDLLLAR